ncbi:hypothetical protein [Micromonospora sp. NPDC004704]
MSRTHDHKACTPADCNPDQPDDINDDTRDLPTTDRDSARVDAYIRATGDGRYHISDGHPLYARDLEAITRAAGKLAEVTHQRNRLDAKLTQAYDHDAEVQDELAEVSADRDRYRLAHQQAAERAQHVADTAETLLAKAKTDRRDDTAELTALTRTIGRQQHRIDDLVADRDNLRQQIHAYRPVLAELTEVIDDRNRLAEQIADLDGIIAKLADADDTAHRQLRAIREARTHACNRHCTEGGCDFDTSAFINRLDEILVGTDDQVAPAASVPLARAQEQAIRQDQDALNAAGFRTLAADPDLFADWLTTCTPPPVDMPGLLRALADKLGRPALDGPPVPPPGEWEDGPDRCPTDCGGCGGANPDEPPARPTETVELPAEDQA